MGLIIVINLPAMKIFEESIILNVDYKFLCNKFELGFQILSFLIQN